MNAVVAGIDRKACPGKAEAVIYVDTVLGRGDGDIAAGDHEGIVHIDSVLIFCRNRKAAASVDGQVVVGENNSAGVVGKCFLGIGFPAGKGVLRAVSKCQEHFVGLIDPQARVIGAVDIYPVQPDPDLGGAVGVHDDAPVIQRSGQYVPSACGYHKVAVQEIGAVSVNFPAASVKGDIGSVCIVCPGSA